MLSGTEFLDIVHDVKEDLGQIKVFTSGYNSTQLKSGVDLDKELANYPTDPVPTSVQTCSNFNDKLLYIFTSGTTGLPKAAVIKNSRYIMSSLTSIGRQILFHLIADFTFTVLVCIISTICRASPKWSCITPYLFTTRRVALSVSVL